MKLWIASDLHLEIRKDFVPEAERPDDFDVLVMAGDVMDGDVRKGVEITSRMAGRKPSVYVAGNHCHWGHSLQAVRKAGMAAGAEFGVHFLQNSTADIEGTTFFGATLWTPVSRTASARPDLSAIMSGLEQDPAPHSALPFGEPVFVQGPGVMDRRAKNRDMRREFEISRAAAKATRADVFVTHFPPTSGLLHELRPQIWIHGHEHRIRDQTLHGTRVLANAIGMPSENRTARGLCAMVVDTVPSPAPKL